MEINKCLEDPNTKYSDQYMPLAMMPGVVEAIQNAGGGGAFLIITADENDVLQKTAGEIATALDSGLLGLYRTTFEPGVGGNVNYGGLLVGYVYDDRSNKYLFTMYPFGQTEAWQYSASTLDDYPEPVE